MATLQEFLFNTGVKFGVNPYMDKNYRMQSNGTMVIPFYCENVPEGAVFLFACDNPKLKEYSKLLVREIKNSLLVSKYAYFTNPLLNVK